MLNNQTNSTIECESAEHIKGMITAQVIESMRKAVFYAVGDTGANDDIVNDAIVRMLSNAEKFDLTKGNIVTWACSIASNLGRNWRKLSAHNGHESEAMTDDSGVAAELVDTLEGDDGRMVTERRSSCARLLAAIETLAPVDQQFLSILSNDFDVAEAGKAVGWSRATAFRRYTAIVAAVSAQF